ASGEVTFCEGGNVILSGNVGGTWSTGAVTPTITVTTAGDYFVTNANGCGSVVSNHIIVTVNPLPIASVITASGDITFCEGNSVILSGNINGTWSTGATTPTITITTSGDYFVTNTNGCGSVSSNHITVIVNPLPIAITGIDASICFGSSIEIGTSSIVGHTYLWTPATGLSSTTISNPIANPIETTTYMLTETITATGCQMSNSVTVTVNPLPVASIISAGGATTFCANENVLLSGNVDGVWSNGLTTPSITVNTTGDYFVTNANGCGSLTSNHILVTVNPIPEAITGIDANICFGDIVTLGASSVLGNTYLWSPTAGLSSSTISNPVALTSVTTTYTLTETITATGCQNSNSVTVLVNTNPSITLQPTNETICIGNSAHFTVEVTGSGLTYQWRNGTVNLTDGGNISGATTSTLTINPVDISDAALNYNVVVAGTCSLKETSMNVYLVVNTSPSITIEPIDQTVCEVGGSASFWVNAIGTGLTYQWRNGNANITDGGNISGANTAMLTISPVNISDVDSDYNVVVSGTCFPTITSLDAALSICNTTEVAISKEANNVVSFFPNPFKTSINIVINETSQNKEYVLRIYNILGEKVFDTTVTKQLTTLEIGSLPQGTYIYRVIDNNKVIQTGKLITQK
ncbi:MAG: T9SS C-terminal target domain-containing protein, partial [Bacteroidales bacterium]